MSESKDENSVDMTLIIMDLDNVRKYLFLKSFSDNGATEFYKKVETVIDAMMQLQTYAKALEPVKPIKGGSSETWWYECETCHSPVNYKQKHCSECGRPILWE